VTSPPAFMASLHPILPRSPQGIEKKKFFVLFCRSLVLSKTIKATYMEITNRIPSGRLAFESHDGIGSLKKVLTVVNWLIACLENPILSNFDILCGALAFQ